MNKQVSLWRSRVSLAHPLRRSVFLGVLAANLLLASTFGVEDAHACSCVRLSLEDKVQWSDAVFSGEVLDARDNPSSAPPGLHLGPVTFDVEEAWKGVSEEQVVVLGYGGGGDCGIDFREGELYLVYATYGGQGEDTALTTDICQGTKSLEAAEGDLEALGPAKLGLPEAEEEPDESKIRDVLEAVSGDEDGLVTVQEGSGSYSTYNPKVKGKEKTPKKEIPKTGGAGSGGAGSGAALLVLGAGVLVLGGGLLAWRTVR